MPAHTIRLRGFWTATPLSGGVTRHTRPFHWPRPVPPGESVWVVATVAGPTRVLVNGECVGEVTEPGDAAFPLPALAPRNEVAVETAGELGDVRLEVRANPG